MCGSYLSVDDFVSAQCARLSESFPANFTHERTRACVHGHVASQVVVRVKHLEKEKKKENNNNSVNIILIYVSSYMRNRKR